MSVGVEDLALGALAALAVISFVVGCVAAGAAFVGPAGGLWWLSVSLLTLGCVSAALLVRLWGRWS